MKKRTMFKTFYGAMTMLTVFFVFMVALITIGNKIDKAEAFSPILTAADIQIQKIQPANNDSISVTKLTDKVDNIVCYVAYVDNTTTAGDNIAISCVKK